jgi:ArsR family transcriptional regulator
MNMNDRPSLAFEAAGRIFRLLAQPARIRILLAVAGQAACVCHLEAWLGYRQAYISQQLMLLREGGLVITQREGKHVFYGLADPAVAGLIRQTARFSGFSEADLQVSIPPGPVAGCPCPECSAQASPVKIRENFLQASQSH